MPRPKNPTPKVEPHIRLEESIASRLEIEAFAPVTSGQRAPYGVKGRIIEAALRKYFKEKDRERERQTVNRELEKFEGEDHHD